MLLSSLTVSFNRLFDISIGFNKIHQITHFLAATAAGPATNGVLVSFPPKAPPLSIVKHKNDNLLNFVDVVY